jgi:hypothetical protein
MEIKIPKPALWYNPPEGGMGGFFFPSLYGGKKTAQPSLESSVF